MNIAPALTGMSYYTMKFKLLFSGSLLLICIALLSNYYIGTLLISPNPVNIGAPPDNFNAEEVSFTGKNGNVISGWFIEGDKDKGGILLMHDVRSNRLQMLDRAEFLNRHGYSVLLFDFQGHGESRGDHITFGYLESLDADAAFLYLENRLANKSIGIIGVSLGGAAALIGQAAQKSDAVILESVYPSIEEAVSNRLAIRLGNAGKYLTPLLTLQLKPRLGFDPDELRPADKIADAGGSVFIMSGTKDRHTTPAESKYLFNAAHEPKIFWEVEGASHVNFSRYKPEEYLEKVLWFFNSYLKH